MTTRIPQAHRAGLFFSWEGRHSPSLVRSLFNGQLLTPGSAAASADYGSPGVLAIAANQGHIGTIPSAARISGDVTLIWVGRLFGTQDNFAYIFGVSDYPTTPNSHVFMLDRNAVLPDCITLSTNNGTDSGVNISSVDVGLSAHYGKEIAIGVSNIAGTTALAMAVVAGRQIIHTSVQTLSGASGAPRYTTAGDKIKLHQDGAIMNGMSTGAHLFQRAMPLSELVQAMLGIFQPTFAQPIMQFQSAAAPPHLLTQIQHHGAFL